MTDILISLRQQSLTQQYATNTTQTWVPSVPVGVDTGVLLPAPKAIAIPTNADITITGVEPCDGLAGWCWQVTTTVDGAIRDQRNVLVPISGTPSFGNLVRVSLSDLRNLNADQVWVGLENNPPPATFRGWWLVSAPGNPALGIETGSGDLRSVL